TTPQMVYTFACTIGSFVNDYWELIQHIVDFVQDKKYEGLNAGKAFVDSIRKRGGLDKICSFCFAVECSTICIGDLYMISLTTDNVFEACPFHFSPPLSSLRCRRKGSFGQLIINRKRLYSAMECSLGI
ncbi:hypothetical protein L208DRAFT_1301910, partial [Tricholoma matsutake]